MVIDNVPGLREVGRKIIQKQKYFFQKMVSKDFEGLLFEEY